MFVRERPEVSEAIRQQIIDAQLRTEGKVGEMRSIEAADAPVGRQPEITCPVLHNVVDHIVDQSLDHGVGPKTAPVVATHPTRMRSEPEVAVAGLAESALVGAVQPLFHVEVAQVVGGIVLEAEGARLQGLRMAGAVADRIEFEGSLLNRSGRDVFPAHRRSHHGWSGLSVGMRGMNYGCPCGRHHGRVGGWRDGFAGGDGLCSSVGMGYPCAVRFPGIHGGLLRTTPQGREQQEHDEAKCGGCSGHVRWLRADGCPLKGRMKFGGPD